MPGPPGTLNIGSYSTVQYSTVQDTVQDTVQYSTVQYSTVQYRVEYLSIRDDVKSVARGSLPDNVVA